jgi:hypothetical protein
MSATYLVQYGTPGFVGRFRSLTPEPLERDRRVVIRGPRGVEVGVVLCEPAERFSHDPIDGDLLRPATDGDTAADLADRVFAAAQPTSLPVAFVDAEATLDGTVILHALPWDACDATPVLDELAARFGCGVKLLDLSRSPTPKEEAGCGKPGCGSGGGGCSTGSCGTGGGCSTGSCSKGKVKSADELTSYFAGLRRKMEADAAGRLPLA